MDTMDQPAHSCLSGPEALRQLCLTTQSTPYTLRDGHVTGMDGGVLPPGVKVWIRKLPTAARRLRVVDGFVEGMGEISIAGNLLRRVDH